MRDEGSSTNVVDMTPITGGLLTTAQQRLVCTLQIVNKQVYLQESSA